MKPYLEYPEGYSPNPNCNGCGTGWNTKLVPDSIYGINITECCCIHDYDYTVGGTQKDKDAADLRLLCNILNTIAKESKWYQPSFLARLRAAEYYDAVARYGESAFNFTTEDKNGSDDI